MERRIQIGLFLTDVRRKAVLTWRRHSRRLMSFFVAFIFHVCLFVSFRFVRMPQNQVHFAGNVLHVSLSPIEHKADPNQKKTENPGELSEAGSTKADATSNAAVQNKEGSHTSSNQDSKGKKKDPNAMACISVEVGQMAKELNVKFPLRYFVQVRTNDASVPGGAWFVDEWMPERRTHNYISNKLFELFKECIAKSDFPEQARKAVNYAPEVRTFSFSVNFTD
ncbi:MAG: hypothetical protein RIR26_2243 [Pseudomonadota bacterium]|jgi:hypothetical protein